MAVIPVSLAESLRPWRDAGLACLLFPAEDPLLSVVREGRERPSRPLPAPSPDARPAAARARPLPARALSDETALSPSGAANRSQPGPAYGGGPRETLSAQSGSIAKRAAHARRQPVEASGREPGSADPDMVLSWPDAWQQIWQRCRPAPLLWTYAELGADLSGSGSAERSALLRRLMAELAFPKGSSVFWPFRLPDEKPGPALSRKHPFFQGLGLLSPQVLIFCGPDAVSGCALTLQDFSQPFSQALYSGMLALLLPDLAAMAAEERSYLQTLAFLRGALADLAVLRPRGPY